MIEVYAGIDDRDADAVAGVVSRPHRSTKWYLNGGRCKRLGRSLSSAHSWQPVSK